MSNSILTDTFYSYFPIFRTFDACSALTTNRMALDYTKWLGHVVFLLPQSETPVGILYDYNFWRPALKILTFLPDALALIEGYYCPFPEANYQDYSDNPGPDFKLKQAFISSSFYTRFLPIPEKYTHILSLWQALYRYNYINIPQENRRVTNLFYETLLTNYEPLSIKPLLENNFLIPSSLRLPFFPYSVARRLGLRKLEEKYYYQASAKTFVAATLIQLAEDPSFENQQILLDFIKRPDVTEFIRDLASLEPTDPSIFPNELNIHILQLAIERGYRKLIEILLENTENVSKSRHQKRVKKTLEKALSINQYLVGNIDEKRITKMRPHFKFHKLYEDLESLTPLASALLANQTKISDVLLKAGANISCKRTPKPFPYLKLTVLDCNENGLSKLLKFPDLCTLEEKRPLVFELTKALCSNKKDIDSLIDTLVAENRFSLQMHDEKGNNLFHKIAAELAWLLAENKSIPKRYNWLFEKLKIMAPKLICEQNSMTNLPSHLLDQETLTSPDAKEWQNRFETLSQSCLKTPPLPMPKEELKSEEKNKSQEQLLYNFLHMHQEEEQKLSLQDYQNQIDETLNLV